MSALVGRWIGRNVRGRMPVRCSFVCVAHIVVTHSCRSAARPPHSVLFTGKSTQSGLSAQAQCLARLHRGSLSPILRAQRNSSCLLQAGAAEGTFSLCQRRSRFQHISASLRAVATRAIFALERFRTRV